MSDDSRQQPIEETLDRELSLRAIVVFTVALVAIMVVAATLTWGMSRWLRQDLEAADPPLPALPEARTQPLPPPPRLQPSPARELEEHMREQRSLLDSWEWVDEAGGTARIPVERALDLALEMDPAALAGGGAPPPVAGAGEEEGGEGTPPGQEEGR